METGIQTRAASLGAVRGTGQVSRPGRAAVLARRRPRPAGLNPFLSASIIPDRSPRDAGQMKIGTGYTESDPGFAQTVFEAGE